MATTKPKKTAPQAIKTSARAPAKGVAKTEKSAIKTTVKSDKTAVKTPVKVAAAKKPAAKISVKATASKKSAAAPKPTAKPTANAAPAKAPASTSPTTKKPVKSVSTQTNANSSFKPYVAKKGEIYMSKEQLAHFADILTRLKDELLADIERTVHTMQDEQTVFADPNDRASQETDMALELRNRDRERKLIKKIEETLDRIKGDDYGYCDKCGIEIGIQRLEARPTATLCIDCKTLEELREKQVAK